MNIFSIVFQDFQLICQPLGANVAGSMHYDRERVEKALISIGKDDLQELYDDGKSEEIVCNFCNKKYEFTHEDIGEILKNK